jgi:beta-phosphoglucomutase family hydrolase
MGHRLQSEQPSGRSPRIALIFDMDGVLIDSNPAHREAWTAFNRRFGIDTTGAMHERMYGRRNDYIVRDVYGAGLAAEEVAARGAAKEALFREMIADRIERLLVPGVRAFLARHSGLPTALASNAEPENIAFVLDRAGLRPCFNAVVDGSQVRHPKPHPEIYLRTADLLGTDPARSIVFEDSHSGVAAARAAGMRVVGIATTHRELPGTEITVGDFRSQELEQWLGSQIAAA